MAWFQVSKSNNGKAWRAEIRRPNVSATVWELIAPDAEFRTAGEARAAIEARYNVGNYWQRNVGRGSTHWNAATNGARSNDALPVRFIIDGAGEVTAIFPTLWGSQTDNVTCYAHIGQHGVADLDYANSRNHRDATADERASLERELRGIYETGPCAEFRTLFVVNNANRDWMRIARALNYSGGY